MHSSISNSEFTAAEQAWLRRYGWLMAVLAIPAGCVVDGLFWAAITLDRSFLPATFSDWITTKGLVFGLALALVPLVWRAGIWIERTWGAAIRTFAIMPVLTVIAVVAAELVFRSFPVQDLLWQSVRARAGYDYFAREISLLRLDEASRRHYGGDQPGVVVAGSSQIMYALDAPRMSSLINMPVYRRAAAGMFTAEMCGASGFMDFNPDNVFLMMLSGLDVGARPALNADGMRPLATPGGISDLRKAATLGYVLRNWRTFVDLSLASVCDLWRSRDYVRMVYANPFAAKQKTDAGDQDAQVADTQRAALQKLGGSEEALAYCTRVLEQFLDRAERSFRRVVVVEGRVNPDFPGDMHRQLTAITRARMLKLEAEGKIDYVTLEEQGITLAKEDWLDMTHVQGEGRRLFTEMFARAVLNTP